MADLVNDDYFFVVINLVQLSKFTGGRRQDTEVIHCGYCNPRRLTVFSKDSPRSPAATALF